MSFYNDKKEVKDVIEHRTVAITNSDIAGQIVAKALNAYFDGNDLVEDRLNHAANVLERISIFVEQNEYTSEEIIDFMREVMDDMRAQALVVSIRDEFGFGKPK